MLNLFWVHIGPLLSLFYVELKSHFDAFIAEKLRHEIFFHI